MIYVYGKTGCDKCIEIKKKLEEQEKEFEYFEDDALMATTARELMASGKLKERLAPLVLLDGEQIIHSEI